MERLPEKRVISIISAKGGVGRSVLACQLALAFEKWGKRVLLFDLDPYVHTQDLYFGVEDRVLFGVYDLLAGKEPQKVAVNCTKEGGVLLCAGGAMDDLPEEKTLKDALDRAMAQCDADLAILDLPVSAARHACYRGLTDLFLLVCTDEPASALGGQYLSELLQDVPCKLVLNRICLEGEKNLLPCQLIDLTGRALVGVVPESPALRSALNGGRAQDLDSEERLPFENIAARIEGEERLLFCGMKDEKKKRRSLF